MQPCPFQNAKTPWPLQPNEIMELADVIKTAIEHFNQFHSSCQDSYFSELRIIAHCYYLTQFELSEFNFHSQIDFNFNKVEQVASFALTVADMINSTSDKIRMLDYPWFYSHFACAVKSILSDKVAYLSQDLTKTHSLLTKIIHKK